VSEFPRLTVGYSALADRVANIKLPAFSFPIEILISIQNPNQIEYSLPPSRQHLPVLESTEVGVAKSRNAVIKSTTTEYLVFADDDATIDEGGISKVIQYLDKHPKCDLALAMTNSENGELRKKYPKRITKLHLFNSAKAGTIEMVVRVKSIKNRSVRFDDQFGAGSINKVGDEYIFISDLLKAGGEGIFLPEVIASHPADSSGISSGRDPNLMGRARVFTRVFGRWAPIIRIAFYMRRGVSNFRLVEFAQFIRG